MSNPRIKIILRLMFRNSGTALIIGTTFTQMIMLLNRKKISRDTNPDKLWKLQIIFCCIRRITAAVVLFLMSIDNPNEKIINSIEAAVKWFDQLKIYGIRVKEIPAPTVKYHWRTSSIDRAVVKNKNAPPIWTRYYELVTHGLYSATVTAR